MALPNNPPLPLTNDNGHIQDPSTGLYIPRTFRSRTNTTFDNITTYMPNGFSAGLTLQRETDSLIVRWFGKGSGLDDLVCEAIVDGNIANVGISPVIAPQISALVRRQQDQAMSAGFELSGRKSPVKKAREAIARFNDSPLGVTQALQQIVRGLRTYNRGAPIATVPLTYAVEEWENYGLNLIPINGQNNKYYLEVDWEIHGSPVPFLPSIYDLEPTGNVQYPYWYQKRLDGQSIWVLLHQSQILPLTAGNTSLYGIGTSAVWLCLGYLAEQILVNDARIERKMNTLSGLVILKGIDESNQQIRDSIQKNTEEAKNQGRFLGSEYTLLTTERGDADFIQVDFRQPDGTSFEEWRQYCEDIIAQCFNEPLSSIVTRGGIGYGAQAETIADNWSELGVGAVLAQVANALGVLYPKVQIVISRENDRAQRLNIDTFKVFADAVNALPEGTLSEAEIRAIIDTQIIRIPNIQEDTLTTSTSPSDDIDDNGVLSPQDGNEEANETNMGVFMGLDAILMKILYGDGDVIISDNDVDFAIQQARLKIDDLAGDLLESEAVEE